MVKEAAAAGFLDGPFGKFPRIQIATVSDLLQGKSPRLPPKSWAAGTAERSGSLGPRPDSYSSD